MTSRVDVQSVPRSPLKTILNFRDVGQTVNILLGKKRLREGVLYRSARPDAGSVQEQDEIRHRYKVKTIVDLRSKTEHLNRAESTSAKPPAKSSLAPVSDGDAAAAHGAIPGITYHAISLTGSSFERALFWRLSWSGMGKLVYHMAAGHRNTGIAVLGREVMNPRGLIGLAHDTLEHSHAEVRAVFEILASSSPPPYPAMIHCMQGKDRTGLMIVLTLLLCEVPLEAISADYMASERELVPEKQERLKEIGGMGLGDEFAGCPADFVREVWGWLEDHYGGVEGYLGAVGVSESSREAARRALMI